MTNNNNLIPKENIAQIEEVREINTEIPSFEEFMKTYESDGNLNYADLNGSDIGTQKGYGPCDKSCETVITDNGNVVYTSIGIVRFHLKIECFNWNGGGGTLYTDNIEGALRHAHRLEDGHYSSVSSEVERKCATLIREAVRHYDRGNKVVGYVRVKGEFWGSYDWSYSY